MAPFFAATAAQPVMALPLAAAAAVAAASAVVETPGQAPVGTGTLCLNEDGGITQELQRAQPEAVKIA